MSVTVTPIKMVRQLPHMVMRNYTYLVYGATIHEALVIDPAWEMQKLELELAARQLNLKAILITHGHQDHIDLVHPLVERHGCEVWMTETDIQAFSFSCDNLHPITTEAPFFAAGALVKPWLTPGHTLGCVCYMIDDNFFTGDTLFIEGCGMCFGKGSDPRLLFRSLQRMKVNLPLATKIFPAHSYGLLPGKEFSFVMQNNVYLSFDAEDAFVSYRMREGQTRLFDFK